MRNRPEDWDLREYGISYAQITQDPPFHLKESAATSAMQKGIWYEEKALKWLEREHLKGSVLKKPWIQYYYSDYDRECKNICQPDCILFDPKTSNAVLVEVKYRHTAEAEEKLFKEYLPLAEHLFPVWNFTACEVVRYYDGGVKGREQKFLFSPWEVRKGEYGVVVYDPKLDDPL